ncbi:MAG: hypothetical protein E7361_04600 [Clostridiales bacterium]|nr:hypothetical protein [Clostridiales bacterium]
MDLYNYAINIEKDNISIYKLNAGIVLSEPNIGLISKKNKDRVIVAGDDATRFVGKVGKDCSFLCPVVNGRIIDIESCASLIDILLSKVEDKGIIKRRNIVFLVPCGLNPKEIEDYISLGYYLSAKNTMLVAKVEGLYRLTTNKKLASMSIILAEDYMDVAVIYDDKIVKGYTIDFGGEVIENSINEYLTSSKGVEVDDKTLQSIKDDMATILPNDYIEEKYYGKEIYSNEYVEFSLNSYELQEFYSNYVGEVADIIDAIQKALSKEVLAELKVSGAIIAGKNAEITGLTKFLSNRLGIDIKVADSVEYAPLISIGSLLNDTDALSKLAFN